MRTSPLGTTSSRSPWATGHRWNILTPPRTDTADSVLTSLRLPLANRNSTSHGAILPLISAWCTTLAKSSSGGIGAVASTNGGCPSSFLSSSGVVLSPHPTNTAGACGRSGADRGASPPAGAATGTGEGWPADPDTGSKHGRQDSHRQSHRSPHWGATRRRGR